MNSESARQTLKRIVQDAVNLAIRGPLPGRELVVDDVEEFQALEFRVRSTLHFFDRGEPYCCSEPGCHVGLHIPERRAIVVDWVRHALDLSECPNLEFFEPDVVHHPGVTFIVR